MTDHGTAHAEPRDEVPRDEVPRDTALIVNGTATTVPASAQLLSALRDQLELTGAKSGCGEGECGACTVLVDGEPARSCQLTAESVTSRNISTIEGMSDGTEGRAPGQRRVGSARRTVGR